MLDQLLSAEGLFFNFVLIVIIGRLWQFVGKKRSIVPIITILKKGGSIKKNNSIEPIMTTKEYSAPWPVTGSTSVHRPSYWLTYNHSKHSLATHSQRYNKHSLSITSPWQYKNYLPGPLTGLETYHNTSVNNALVRLRQISLDNWKNGIKHYYIIMLFPVLIFEPVTQTKRNFWGQILSDFRMECTWPSCIFAGPPKSLSHPLHKPDNVQMLKMR